MKSLPNLLIVDDTEINLTLLESIIRKVEVNLIRALSGTEALEKTREVDLALAIIDVRMPGMDGYELALKINKKRSGAKVPIIFLTANYFDETEVFKGYDSGAIDYIIKPVNRRILLSKISVFLDLFNQKQIIIRDATLLKKSAAKLIRANAALSRSEEKYRTMLNASPDGIILIDLKGFITEVSAIGLELLGVDNRNELIADHFLRLIPSEEKKNHAGNN